MIETIPPKKRPAAPESASADDSIEETTAEEQMARFEDALKEEDWGHQPC